MCLIFRFREMWEYVCLVFQVQYIVVRRIFFIFLVVQGCGQEGEKIRTIIIKEILGVVEYIGRGVCGFGSKFRFFSFQISFFRGYVYFVGQVLWFRVEVFGYFLVASGEVQDGGGSYVSGFRVVGVVEVCGRGGSVGVVFGGSGFWERFGCKEGIILG